MSLKIENSPQMRLIIILDPQIPLTYSYKYVQAIETYKNHYFVPPNIKSLNVITIYVIVIKNL